MNSFVSGLKTSTTVARTKNGAITKATSGNALVDLFFLAGSSRGKNIIPQFTAALAENTELALRLALWTRDVRGGAGERETFRSFLKHLEATDFKALARVLPRVPDVGRWDDVLVLESDEGRALAFDMINAALDAGNGLCAKWMPRKGPVAEALREYLGYSPKRYRKTLVSLTNVVETKMCAGQWAEITYDHVPSIAAKNYRKAFWKHNPEGYKNYVEALKKPVKEGEKPEAKINAGAIFPHDVLKPFIDASFNSYLYGMRRKGSDNAVTEDVIAAQWAALPDFVGEGSFIPLSDVSGSMTATIGNTNVAFIDVSIALGMYLAERNKGAFKDVILHFSSTPKIEVLKGDLKARVKQYTKDVHMGSTNLEAAFDAILAHAKKNNVPEADMPKNLIILSDMEFNQTCQPGRYGEVTNYDSARRKYAEAGYNMPNVVFWNLNGRAGNSPVTVDNSGTALVSGFSPSIMKSLLSGKSITPYDIMLNTIMSDRYALADA